MKGIHIVTGVSKGIGKALVVKLLEQGDAVAGLGRTNCDIDHPNYLFCKTDVRYDDQVKSALEQVRNWRNLQIASLINNAGLGIFKNLEDTSADEWKLMFDTNVNGIFHTCRHIVPIMREQKSGHIVNISSIAGTTGIPGATAYCGTKFAVRGISLSLFKEVRKDHIKVTCVYPGSVNTEFFTNYEGVTSNASMLDASSVAESIVSLINTPANFVTTEMEIRPINPSYK